MFLRHRSNRRESSCGRLWLVLLVASFWAALAQADAELDGEGTLGRRNLIERSLEIGGAVYFFTDGSVILDRQGVEVSLESLAVAEAGGEPRLLLIQSGRFSAVEVLGRYVIQRLELIESPR